MTTYVVYQGERRVGRVVAVSPEDALSVFRRGPVPVPELRAYVLRHIITRRRS